jgi:hypothetical protein
MPMHVLLQCKTLGILRKRLFDQVYTTGSRDLTDYNTIVSDPLTTHYVAQFMHQTSLLAQFQHAEQEESDDETGDFEVTA